MDPGKTGDVDNGS